MITEIEKMRSGSQIETGVQFQVRAERQTDAARPCT